MAGKGRLYSSSSDLPAITYIFVYSARFMISFLHQKIGFALYIVMFFEGVFYESCIFDDPLHYTQIIIFSGWVTVHVKKKKKIMCRTIHEVSSFTNIYGTPFWV